MKFPQKLFKLLEEADLKGYSSIVSWLPDGKAFCVHKPKAFCEKIMKAYFNQTKFNSFTRQVSSWLLCFIILATEKRICPRFTLMWLTYNLRSFAPPQHSFTFMAFPRSQTFIKRKMLFRIHSFAEATWKLVIPSGETTLVRLIDAVDPQ